MATRDLTAPTIAQANAQSSWLLIFVELDFSSGPVRATNAGYPVDWNAQTWLGLAELGTVEAIDESLSIEAKALKFTVQGVDNSKVAIALGEKYQGRAARMWVGFVEAGVGIVADPALAFAGRIDQMIVQRGDKEAAVSVTAESRFAAWNRAKLRRYSDADQQAAHPGDLGLQYIAELAGGREQRWGVI
jgi:hypothetical protein